MAQINRPIPSLFNGISQQPTSVRLASQGEIQENARSTLVDGLEKRPPSQHIAKVRTAVNSDAFIHWINRDSANQFKVIIEDGKIEVYNLAGVSQTVLYTLEHWWSFDEADATTLEVGQKRQVSLPPGVTQIVLNTFGIAGGAIITWESSPTGLYAGEESSVRVDTSNTNGNVNHTNGDYIRARISTTGSGTPDADINANNVQYLRSTTPRAEFKAITVADFTFMVNTEVTAQMDAAILSNDLLTGTVQLFSDLPGAPSTGQLYEIAGDPATLLDQYYVRFDANVWQEDVRPLEVDGFDAASMPHELVHDQTANTFTFKESAWTRRSVGDASSAPEPSFIGRKINDVFFHKNRLGFLADENVITSRSGQFFNFFRETATAVLDSDPIDIASTGDVVSILKSAVPFDDSLLLFADKLQFTLTAGGEVSLTPKTATITPTTRFDASLAAAPAAAGQNVYFATESGNFTHMREYFVEVDAAANKDASNITAHVPSYIPKNVFKIVASTNNNTVFALSLDERNVVYVYKFFWGGAGNKKLQSSWSKWIFDTSDIILGVEFYNHELFMSVQRADGVFLDKINLQLRNITTNFPFDMLLDRRNALSGSYDSGTDLTTWTTPYELPISGTLEVVLDGDWGGHIQLENGQQLLLESATNDTETIDLESGETSREGELLVTTNPTNLTATAVGDLTANGVIVGIKYNMLYRFSEQFMKDSANPPNAISEGRLMLRRMFVRFTRSGFFRAVITPRGRGPFTYVMTGKTIGDALIIGEIGIAGGEHKFPVLSNAESVIIDITNDSRLPCVLQSAEWKGTFSMRAKRS